MKKILVGGLLLLITGLPIFGESLDNQEPLTLEYLFTQGQELSSDYIMATYDYANILLGANQQELANEFRWTVTTGDLTYYWNEGDDPTPLNMQTSSDVKAHRLTGSPGIVMDIPLSGTSITFGTPFSVDLQNNDYSTVTPSFQLTQDIISPEKYERRATDLNVQKTLLAAESSITIALIQLELSILTAISELLDAQIAYEKALQAQKTADVNFKQVVDVLGYTEDTTTYQESLMATLEVAQGVDFALFELTQAQDTLELLTGYRTLPFEDFDLPLPSPSIDEMRATTSLMSTDLDVSLANYNLQAAEAGNAFGLSGVLGGNLTVGNGEVLDSNISTGLNAQVGDGLTFGVSAATNLNRKDFLGGVSFTYTPQVSQHGNIAQNTAENSYLQAVERRNLVENRHTSQKAQFKNQISLWKNSYELANRRYSVAKNQYDQESALFEEGYSTKLSLEDKAISLLEAENSVMQSLITGLLLERSIELFYNS